MMNAASHRLAIDCDCTQYIHKGSQVLVTAEWLRPSAWIDQSGTPQASIDLDANRLILLDRLTEGQFENGDSEESTQDIPF
jgi:single-stranded DNA-binding protein